MQNIQNMQNVDELEVERKIRYWQYTLSKIESEMLRMQSKRVGVKHKLIHLQLLQKQGDLQLLQKQGGLAV